MAEPETPRSDPRLERLTLTPELFLKDFNPDRDLAILSPMTEASYRQSVFMDDRLVRGGARDLALSLNALGQVWQRSSSPARAVHYIGHMGHCGSTLLSRLLGELSGFHCLREPPVLVGLSRSLRRIDTPGFPLDGYRWGQLLELAALMMQRTWRPDDVAVVKPTSAVGNLLPALMNRTGNERGVLLYVHLEDWLPLMLRPEVRRETRLFARDFRLADFREAAGATLETPDSPGALAAMTWLLQAGEFARLLRHPQTASRVRLLHLDTLLEHPLAILARLCDWFGKPQTEDRLEAVCARLLGADAKRPGQAYGPQARRADLERARLESAAEVEAGIAWAHRTAGQVEAFAGLIEAFPAATALPAPAPAA